VALSFCLRDSHTGAYISTCALASSDALAENRAGGLAHVLSVVPALSSTTQVHSSFPRQQDIALCIPGALHLTSSRSHAFRSWSADEAGGEAGGEALVAAPPATANIWLRKTTPAHAGKCFAWQHTS
jgi:hypothetical protein